MIRVRRPHPHPAQQRIIHEARRFNVVACGRRFGKSVLGEDRLIGPALEGYPVAWFSPTYKMLTEIWRDLRRMLAPAARRLDTQQHRIELVTGGVVEMWSLDTPDVARGRKYKRVVIDEAAMVRDLGEAWQAVIRPTLADYRGDAWLLSTPKGRNFFAQAFTWGMSADPGYHEWAAWQMPAAANPYILPDEIAAMAATMPERTYRQEILAEFLEDAGGVFRRVTEARTADPNPAPLPRTYVAGLDWGRAHDWTVIVVKDADSGAYVAIDRFNRIDWAFQRARIAELARRWNVRAILAERNSMGEPNIEALVDAGLPVIGFTTTNATKARVIEQLALNLEQGRTTFPAQGQDWDQLAGELQSFEMERLPSGMMRYGAPAGMHDDCVIAAALADEAAAAGTVDTATYDRFGRRIG